MFCNSFSQVSANRHFKGPSLWDILTSPVPGPSNAFPKMLWSQFHIGRLRLRENFIAILTHCNSRCHDVMRLQKVPPHLGGSCSPFEKDYSNWIISQNRSNHQLVVVCGCLWKKSGRKSKYVKVKGGNPNHCEVCILYIYMYVTIKYI